MPQIDKPSVATVRHPELASAVESGSAELAIFSLAFMLDDRLQELTEAIRRLSPPSTQQGGSLRLAVNGPVAIECEHGWDACPQCDSQP